MKTLMMAAAAVLALSAGATGAHAATITFDDLSGCCFGPGEGYPLAPNMTFDGTNLTYTSGDYILSFAGGSAAHIGDGGVDDQTFNWHDGPDNDTGSVLSLARVDGTAFDLASFDYFANDGFMVTAPGYAPLNLAAGGGTASPDFNNILSVSFYGPGGTNQVDNIVVNAASAAPEPTSWGMMIAGFGLAGGALRRTRKLRATSVKASIA